MGVEAASAKWSRHDTLSSESDVYFIDIIVAPSVYQVKISRTKQLNQFLFVAASLQFVEERSELLVIEF